MWQIVVRADKMIRTNDVRTVLESLGRAIIKGEVREEHWGWEGYLCRVHYPTGNEILITGPWANLTGQNFAHAISRGLRKLGYKSRVYQYKKV